VKKSPEPPIGVADQRLLHGQLLLVAVLAGVALIVMLLPIGAAHIAPGHYLLLHTLLEFISILAAFLVFATVWYTPAKEVSASLLLIAAGLFAAGWLDFAHAMSFLGMPDRLLTGAPQKGSAFWLVARLVVALTLFSVSFHPQLPAPRARTRYAIVAAYGIATLALVSAVILHEAGLPAGAASFKRGVEWSVTALLAFAAWRYYRLARRSDSETYPLIFGAAAVAALGSLFLTGYNAISDVQDYLGHLYKSVSYSLFFQAMFVVSVRRPYLRLAAQAQTLASVNERLRTRSLALSSTAMPVMVADLEGRVQWRNRASYALMGATASEIADGFNLFAPPATLGPKAAASIRRTVESGNVWRGLVECIDDRGKQLILDRTVTPLRNDEGGIEGYVSTAENVTGNTRAQLRYKRVLDTAIDGFWIVDPDGSLLEVNDAYAAMSGYSVAELLSMNASQLEAAEFTDAIHVRMTSIVRHGHGQFETRHRHAHGHKFAVDISATYDPESKNFFIFLRDRSERMLAAAIKRDLELQLLQSQKMQALGQLTGGIAHDFNNALAAILGYANLALERFAPDKQGKLAAYLREVIGASERSRDLVAKMLTFTRTQPNAGAGVIAPALVIAEVLAMMRPSIPSSIELRSHIIDALHVRMDAGELNQMLVNLIINARDAIDGHGTIDIRLNRIEINGRVCAVSHQRLSGTYLAVEVSDNGKGIAPEHVSRLFDPFFTTKDVGKGTGLGLSMLHGILTRSGGHVVVESEPGRGSRFGLLFPIALPAELAPETPPSHPNAPAGTGQSIWVVDDEPAVARCMGELLENCGYRVRLFNDPALVMAAFDVEKSDLDLLITDQTMPGLSGVELATRLHWLKPSLPIILCTGFRDGIDEAALPALGIRRYFGKPVPAAELLKAVAENLVAHWPEPAKTLN
jgi:PAS domain S-box-containing protein